MTDLRDAAQAALEALERYQVKRQDFERFADEITALRAALAEPEVQSTHSAECYKWHHECARAEVERLRAALKEKNT